MLGRLYWYRRTPGTAAEWFALRLQERARTATEAEFRRWLAADPRHHREYALCEIAWSVSREAAGRVQAGPGAGQPQAQDARRRWLGGRALAAGVAGILIAVLVVWLYGPPPHSPAMHYVTGPGEQRFVSLTDGSQVLLNTRSELKVTLRPHSREVVLKTGEAYFDVAHDPTRPFRVLTAYGVIDVLGTRFSVYQRADVLEVATEQGLVRVSAAGLPSPATQVLVKSGEAARVDAPDAPPRVGRADLERIRNWRNRQLDFNDVPLAQMLEEFSRYIRVPLHVEDPRLAELRVSGVFNIGDMAALSATLHGAFGLTIRNTGTGKLLVERAPAGQTPEMNSISNGSPARSM